MTSSLFLHHSEKDFEKSAVNLRDILSLYFRTPCYTRALSHLIYIAVADKQDVVHFVLLISAHDEGQPFRVADLFAKVQNVAVAAVIAKRYAHQRGVFFEFQQL